MKSSSLDIARECELRRALSDTRALPSRCPREGLRKTSSACRPRSCSRSSRSRRSAGKPSKPFRSEARSCSFQTHGVYKRIIIVHSICNPFLTVSCPKDHLKSRDLTILCFFKDSISMKIFFVEILSNSERFSFPN